MAERARGKGVQGCLITLLLCAASAQDVAYYVDASEILLTPSPSPSPELTPADVYGRDRARCKSIFCRLKLIGHPFRTYKTEFQRQ
mgnify:CR=1 FL=1